MLMVIIDVKFFYVCFLDENGQKALS